MLQCQDIHLKFEAALAVLVNNQTWLSSKKLLKHNAGLESIGSLVGC